MASDQTAAIRQRLDAWAQASRSKDIDAILACYAPDAVSYDCHSVFELKGRDAYRQHLEACFPHMVGPLTFEIHDLSIAAGEDVGFAHFTLYCCATGPEGTEHPCWLRASTCLRRIEGTWLIAHDHCSAPFNPMTEQVMLDAGPEALKQARAA